MKNKIVAALLAIFLGWLGIHEFYLNKNISKATTFLIVQVVGFMAMILSIVPFINIIAAIILFFYFIAGTVLAIWGLVDGIILLTMEDKDFDKMYNGGKDSEKYFATHSVIPDIDLNKMNLNKESPTDTLKKLGEMQKEGIITQEEFDEKKKEIMKRI